MDIDSILRAIDSIDQARDKAEQRRIKLITRANGSHRNIEGSTGESKFSLLPNEDAIQVNLV